MNPAKRRAAIQAGNLRSRCSQIFLRLQAANPHPTTELEYSTPFEPLFAVMLSAQARLHSDHARYCKYSV
jgi:endonuclease III